MGLDSESTVLVTAIAAVVSTVAVVAVLIGLLVAALCAYNRYRGGQMKRLVKKIDFPTDAEITRFSCENLTYDYAAPRSLIAIKPGPFQDTLTHNPAYGCREACTTDSDESKR